jgi:hypothetical protein
MCVCVGGGALCWSWEFVLVRSSDRCELSSNILWDYNTTTRLIQHHGLNIRHSTSYLFIVSSSFNPLIFDAV